MYNRRKRHIAPGKKGGSMPTQEERLSALEKFQSIAAAHIRETDENTTILLGVIRDQGRDIKRTFQRLEVIDERLGTIDGRLDTLENHMERLEGRMGGLEGHMGGLEGHMGKLEGHMDGLESRMGGLEGHMGKLEGHMDGLESHTGSLENKMDQVLVLLGSLTTKPVEETE